MRTFASIVLTQQHFRWHNDFKGYTGGFDMPIERYMTLDEFRAQIEHFTCDDYVT